MQRTQLELEVDLSFATCTGRMGLERVVWCCRALRVVHVVVAVVSALLRQC